MKTTIEKVIYLQRIEMFADIPSEQLAHLAGITKSVSYKKGETIFEQGDPSHSMYVLVDGKIDVIRDGKKVRELSDDTAFGIWSFFDHEPRMVTTRTTEDCRLLKIDSTDFFDLLEERVHLSRGLLKYFAKRFRELVEVAEIPSE